MVRDSTVRLSSEEKKQLDKLQSEKFSDDASYGDIIGKLCENERDFSEQKLILITGEGTSRMYGYKNSIDTSHINVITTRIGDGGKKIRGYSPDMLILLTDIDDEIRENVINPMVMSGTKLVEL